MSIFLNLSSFILRMNICCIVTKFHMYNLPLLMEYLCVWYSLSKMILILIFLLFSNLFHYWKWIIDVFNIIVGTTSCFLLSRLFYLIKCYVVCYMHVHSCCIFLGNQSFCHCVLYFIPFGRQFCVILTWLSLISSLSYTEMVLPLSFQFAWI